MKTNFRCYRWLSNIERLFAEIKESVVLTRFGVTRFGVTRFGVICFGVICFGEASIVPIRRLLAANF